VDRWSWTISIPGVPSMVPAARAFVRAFLDSHPLATDAELITSEYVTNAIRHTSSGEGGVIHLTIASTPRAVRIEVTDHGRASSSPDAGTEPAPQPGGACGEGENGRGLLIVDYLATRWGHFGVSGGPVTAWAELGDPAAGEAGGEGGGEPGGEAGGGRAGGGATSARRE
jgi:anti-sigma regulatory factor (Ser/Thr protein kinase)